MLTIQIHTEGRWQDVATLEIENTKVGRGGTSHLAYEPTYSMEWLDRDDHHACSLTLPVELFMTHERPSWFSFLDDIMPSGASRRFWVSKLGIGNLSPQEQDYLLLKAGTIAPVGNIRIKESIPDDGHQTESARFSIIDVVERNSDFLEYAQQRGAAAGGATGAGGEAPKLLLRLSENEEVWIDSLQENLTNTDIHYLVKFPRGSRSAIDCDILRAEYHYYHELEALGMETIPTKGMRLHEGTRYPSLWLPRFDIHFNNGKSFHCGLESVYSILEKPPATMLNHFKVIEQLADIMSRSHTTRELRKSFDISEFVIEWVKRDFLNACYGNSDNHGRNTAFLKEENGIWLSPIYDFAPMKADPEGISRSLQWGPPFEVGGKYDWPAICDELSAYVDPDVLLHELKTLAVRVSGITERLRQRGVPESIIKMPTMGFEHLDKKLNDWGVL